VSFDQINNAIMLKKRPGAAGGEGKEFILPTDRNRKPIPNRYTTPAVEAAVSEYVTSVERAVAAVRKTLQALSEALRDDLPVLITALHMAVVLQAAAGHVAAARQRGWVLPVLRSETARGDGAEWTMEVEGLTPYWMDRAVSVGNSFCFGGIFLLTAPNMSGKSTLMRSMTVAALLANCGLYVPCRRAVVPRYDNFFMRTASYDVPSEGKSAFALEMDDVRVMLRDCTSRSLVMLDEIGKGTSARDGAALSGALLETLDQMPVSAVFATHLHEIFDLPLSTRHVTCKRMGTRDQGGRVLWTYRLEDGRCTNSMAMTTARAYGIPPAILDRAEQLASVFDAVCRGAERGGAEAGEQVGLMTSGVVCG
jgi:DNA mismatch repair ATPase MutS